MRYLLLALSCICSASAPAVADIVPVQIKGGLIFIEVSTPDHPLPLHMVLDTGSEETVLSKRAAKALGLRQVMSESVRRVDGMVKAHRAENCTLTIGNQLSIAGNFLVMDFRRESKIVGREIDGLIGVEFLEGRSIKIDFASQHLDLFHEEAIPEEASILPISRNFGALCVTANVGDVTLSNVRIDTGSTKALSWTVPSDAPVKSPKRDGKKLQTSVALGDHAFTEIETHVFRNDRFEGEDGLLGNDILLRFDSICIDMINDRLILEGG